MSLEGRRLDIIESALGHTSANAELLEYTYDAAMTLVDNRTFRDEVRRAVVNNCMSGCRDASLCCGLD